MSNMTAYDRMKKWLTGNIQIHMKSVNSGVVPDKTHWIQHPSNPNDCPIFDEDSRVKVIGDLRE